VKRSAPLQRRAPLRRGKPLKRGGPLKRGKPLKRTSGLKRRRRPESSAAKAARLAFNENVCAEPCFFADYTEAGEPRRPGHVCDGPKDAHHLIEKQWIKRYFGDLPEDELLEILFATIIGCPLCRYGAHEPVTRKTARIYFDELDPDLIDFCIRIDERYALPSRPSILARLEIECPKREAAPTASDRSSHP
jgi:hypothetical protein